MAVTDPLNPLSDFIDSLTGGRANREAYRLRMQAQEESRRTLRSAKTYLGKAAKAAKYDPYEATQVLHEMMEGMRRLVDAMPSEFFVESEGNFQLKWAVEEAHSIVDAFARGRKREAARAKVLKMEDSAGRTPEEAESFLRSAASLRERHNLGPRT